MTFSIMLSILTPTSSPFLHPHSALPSATDLTLDKSILLWVLLPITFVMFLQGVLRQYITILLKDDKQIGTTLALSTAKDTMETASKNSVLIRSRRLRQNAQFLQSSAVSMRRKMLIQKAMPGALPAANGDASSAPAAPAQDPTAMMGMMKNNMSMMIPNMLLMGWVSYFFSGFVIVKLPIMLTERMKQMLQRGVMLQSLPVQYVSSISWYFLNLLGLRGLFTLVLGEGTSAIDNPDLAMMQGGQQPGQAPDFAKLYAGEKMELEIMPYEYSVPAAEQRILNRTLKSATARTA